MLASLKENTVAAFSSAVTKIKGESAWSGVVAKIAGVFATSMLAVGCASTSESDTPLTKAERTQQTHDNNNWNAGINRISHSKLPFADEIGGALKTADGIRRINLP